MPIWLASYPRSGNTLSRLVLKNVFGLCTRTIVGAGGDQNFVGKAGVLELVGAVSDPTSGEDLIEEARKSPEIYLVKTHDAPLTDDPAIYVVRDGRSSIVSYFHFSNEIGKHLLSLDQVILGNVYAGSWSDHLQTWAPDIRPRTIILRYEDLVGNMAAEINKLSSFLKIPPISDFNLSFSDLNQRFPDFFRVGNDGDNIAELQRSGFVDLFYKMHGPMMHKFGYGM